MTAPAGDGSRSALVTGAGQGLGHELCQVYLRRGWTVFPLVRRDAAVARFRSTPAGRCHPIVADLRREETIGVVRAAVATRTDRIDVLVNNAGVPGESVHLATVPPREIGRLLDVHCLGVVRCTQAVLPQLRASGGAKVINVTSRLGSLSRNAAGEFGAESVSYAYRIAKAAQNMLTICMSQELGREEIIVCALHPGQFRTALNPEAALSPAVAAQRVVRWIDRLRPADRGTWHDTGTDVDPEPVQW